MASPVYQGPDLNGMVTSYFFTGPLSPAVIAFTVNIHRPAIFLVVEIRLDKPAVSGFEYLDISFGLRHFVASCCFAFEVI